MAFCGLCLLKGGMWCVSSRICSPDPVGNTDLGAAGQVKDTSGTLLWSNKSFLLVVFKILKVPMLFALLTSYKLGKEN